MEYLDLLNSIHGDRASQQSCLNLLLSDAGLENSQILTYKTKQSHIDKALLESIYLKILNYNKGIPLQYILGYTWFYNLKLKVNPSVLIPRPETEELVTLIIEDNRDFNTGSIMDIGTGSGCIALALKKHFINAGIYALDINEDALKIAAENSINNNLSLHLIHDDILNPRSINHSIKYDIIVSNPPYIPISRSKDMTPGVVDFEPHTALFINDEDPFIFYTRILDFASSQLKENGKVYFEISQYEYLTEYKDWKLEIHTDMSGNKRFLMAIKGS